MNKGHSLLKSFFSCSMSNNNCWLQVPVYTWICPLLLTCICNHFILLHIAIIISSCRSATTTSATNRRSQPTRDAQFYSHATVPNTARRILHEQSERTVWRSRQEPKRQKDASTSESTRQRPEAHSAFVFCALVDHVGASFHTWACV